jgi:hypothetical protein
MAGMVVRWGTTIEAIENASCNCPLEHLTFIADLPRAVYRAIRVVIGTETLYSNPRVQ